MDFARLGGRDPIQLPDSSYVDAESRPRILNRVFPLKSWENRLVVVLPGRIQPTNSGEEAFFQIIHLENGIQQFAGNRDATSLTTKHQLCPLSVRILDQFQQGRDDLPAGGARLAAFRQ